MLLASIACLVLVAVGVAGALGWFSRASEGPNCVAADGLGECAEARAFQNPIGIAVTADGKNAYVASGYSDAVAIFDRDPSSGALTQKDGTAGCVSESGTTTSDLGTKSACQNGQGLEETFGLTVSRTARTSMSPASAPTRSRSSIVIGQRDS